MNLIGKHVLLLTTTNLACNPRCLKEVKLLLSRNATVSVVAFNLHNWTANNEMEINIELSDVNFYYLETTSRLFFPWFISSILERAGRGIISFFPNNLFLANIVVSRRCWILMQWLKQYKIKPDMVIAHNPGTFYPAYQFTKKNNIPFAIDIEDYHPGENLHVSEKKSVTLLMKQLIPEAVYTSFASPLIKLFAEKLAGATGKYIVINNLFSKDEFIEPVLNTNDTTKIKLVWFSQYIDYGRGLENILPVLDKVQDDFELTLIGNMRSVFFDNELKDRNYICCKDSMPHTILQKELSKYDIGLAIEDGTVDSNRDICLTNKIWSYFQSGLFIIASDTKAQKMFMEEHLLHGISTSLSNEILSSSFVTVLKNKEHIRASKITRFKNALNYNWENESIALMKQWEDILQ